MDTNIICACYFSSLHCFHKRSNIYLSCIPIFVCHFFTSITVANLYSQTYAYIHIIIYTTRNIQITTFLILIFASPKEVKDPNLNSLTASTSSTSSIRHAAYTKGLSVFVNLHVRIYTGFFLVALSLLVYAVSVPSVGVAIAMGYVMGIGDATAQSGIYVSYAFV